MACCKSSIYIVNTNYAAPANGEIPLGSIARRTGRAFQLNGNSVTCYGVGTFDVTCSVTLTPVGAGDIGVQLLANGSPIPGATATVTGTAGSTVTLPVIGTVRSCGCDAITIGARLVSGDVTTGATIDNIATRIEVG